MTPATRDSATGRAAAAHRARPRRGRSAAALLAALAIWLIGGPAIAASPGSCDVPDVVARSLSAVVNISVVRVLGTDSAGHPSDEHFVVFVGSGEIVDPSGLIVTNKHVIQDAAVIRVTFQDRTQVPAQLVAAANLVDLAVLKVNMPKPLPTLSFGDSEALRIGQPVIAIGNPLGVGTSVSTGVVSGVNRNLMRSPFDDYIQTDASINPGNSGGPLLDCSGHIVGVDTALLSNNSLLGSIGLGFALPADDVHFVVNMLRDTAQDHPNWVGLRLQDMTASLAATFHRPDSDGAIVTGVDPGSPAERAALKPGDVIIGVDHEALLDSRAAQRAFVMIHSGVPITLKVWRDGHAMQVTLKGEPWPHMMALRSEVLASPENIARAEAVGPGLFVSQIIAADRTRFDLGDAKGVLIDSVIPGSQADAMDLHPGDVIEQVDEQPATSPQVVDAKLMRGETASGSFVALLVRDSSKTRWVSLWTGRIDAKDLVTGPMQSGAATRVHDVSGQAK